MPTIPMWLIGAANTTLTWTPCDLASNGVLTIDAGGAISLYGQVDEWSIDLSKTEENISPMHYHRANWVTIETDQTVEITEILKSGSANLLAGIFLASAWSEYGIFTAMRGLGTYVSLLKTSRYRETIRKGKSVGVMTARMVLDLTPGVPNPEYT